MLTPSAKAAYFDQKHSASIAPASIQSSASATHNGTIEKQTR